MNDSLSLKENNLHQWFVAVAREASPISFNVVSFFFPPNMNAYTKGLSHSLVLAQQPNIRFDADPHVRTIPGPHDHLCRFLLFPPCSWRNNWSLFVAITIISIIILLEVLLLQYTTTFQVGIYMCVCVCSDQKIKQDAGFKCHLDDRDYCFVLV